MSVLWIWITSWLKDNWVKLLKVAAIIVAVVLIGGLIYETVAGRVSRRRSDALILTLRTDNQRIRDGLVDAEDRVVNLEETLGKAERASEELGRELGESQARTAELKDINIRFERENIRLGEALSSSSSAAGSITKYSGLLEESIDRAIEIVERYAENP